MARFYNKIIEHKICVLISSTTFSATFLILTMERDMMKHVY